MTDTQQAARWCAFVKMILSGTLIDKNEPPEDIRSRRALLEADPEEWFRYYFSKFSYAQPATFQQEATDRVLVNPEWCEVRMWSRELAKSTRTMMEVFYLVLVGHLPGRAQEKDGGKNDEGEKAVRKTKRCVLLISNSLDNATRLLMPYKSNLEYNQRILQDYGMQKTNSIWSATEFITAGGISFRAVGVGQSPRGTRNEEVRPDIILFDDLDTDADCLNAEIVARKWHWIEEAAIGTRSVSEPTTIIFCGNRIAIDSCIERAADIADHASVVNIRNADGHSVWPQKNSETDIDRVLSQKSYAAQQKEYFNNPVTEGSVFKEMAYKPARPLAEYEVLLCYTDPSYKATNDYKATVLVGKWKGEFHVLKCYLEQATTAQMIEWHVRIMNYVGSRACYYYMEEVFMQDVLVKEVSDAGKRLGRTIPILGDRRKKPDKYMRIESLLEPMVRNGELYLNEEERHNPHMQRLAVQFTAFAAGGAAHDDGPDAVEGAVWLINDKFGKKDVSGFEVSGKARNSGMYAQRSGRTSC
jgi:predicted phage terminase large subunit-like protein